MLFHCPYCHQATVPAPPETPHPHAECGNCHARPRAVITPTQTGEKLIQYVKDGRKPTGEVLVKINARIPEQQARHFAGRITQAVRRGLDLLEDDELRAQVARGKDVQS